MCRIIFSRGLYSLSVPQSPAGFTLVCRPQGSGRTRRWLSPTQPCFCALLSTQCCSIRQWSSVTHYSSLITDPSGILLRKGTRGRIYFHMDNFTSQGDKFTPIRTNLLPKRTKEERFVPYRSKFVSYRSQPEGRTGIQSHATPPCSCCGLSNIRTITIKSIQPTDRYIGTITIESIQPTHMYIGILDNIIILCATLVLVLKVVWKTRPRFDDRRDTLCPQNVRS